MKTIALVLLAACGSSEPGADWSGKPLDVTVKATANKLPYTIKMPAGMVEDDISKGDDISKLWRADQKDYFSEPSVMVSFNAIPATSLDDFVRETNLGATDVVAKKAALPDGFVDVHHTKDFGHITVDVMKVKGATHLTCRASQARTGGVPSPEKTIAWLEQLCMSLAIQ